jgi:hypothetical protein
MKDHEPRRYFSQTMHNPYFSSEHYKKETNAGKYEEKIENFVVKIKKILFRKY